MKYLVLILVSFIISCGSLPDPGGVYKKSNYYNNVEYQLDATQAYFESTYNYTFKRDFKEFVAIYFYEDMEDVKTLCRSSEPVAGCITSYWVFVIYDSPDRNIRCQTILHEAAHMALFNISGGTNLDYEHKDISFTTFVFDEKNCGFEEVK
jgi:hypothetical protein